MVESRDIIAIVVIVFTFVALIFKSLSPEQALAIVGIILGYYFGYRAGYERGVSVGREEKA